LDARRARSAELFDDGLGRQGLRQRPLSLEETPGLWVATARSSIGLPAIAIAAGAVAAALGLLLLPSLFSTGPPKREAAATRAGPRLNRASLPRLKVLRRSPDSAFTVAGARFRVYRGGPPTAVAVQARAGHGGRWVTVGVEGQNLHRSHFNPDHLSYRLLDGRGNAYYPESSGGTGPASLGETGFLGQGETAHADLSFRVPESARRLTLVFEPAPSGRVQVRVPVDES
jgi:hypothetical protein